MLRGELDGHSPNDVASFLQTWMYFGLLSTVLDVPGSSYKPEFSSVKKISEDEL